MAFFDGLGKKLTDAGQATAQKAKDLAEIAKQNSAISDEEKKINAAYLQIGKMYVEKFGETADGDFAALIADIALSGAKIAECKQKIQEVKGISICPSCGAEIPLGNQFCAKCGAKVEVPAPAVEAEAPAADASAESDSAE
ncbi:MAG: zinc ribbon domain-containing protein [Acetatifactor sp.]|nr:zinc ribbon domain-containing protein [Acetatifactor sp.]